jgi:hypothetical protein
MGALARVKYDGGLPGASATVDLFNSVTARMRAGMSSYGAKRLYVALQNDQAGTLRLYESKDGGATWNQVTEDAVAASVDTDIQAYDFYVAPYLDIKLELENGGDAQTTFEVDMTLECERSPVA